MNNAIDDVVITETERLIIREITKDDAAFVFELLNSPGFLKYIGDRGVRSVEDAQSFIETRYRQSYRDHGYGLYTVELKVDQGPIGICGFVRREMLPGPDIGFAFLPQFEGKGFGFESADAMLAHGCEVLGFERVLAITTLNNEASIRLLEKLGFTFREQIRGSDGEPLNLYSTACLNGNH
jgi:RimJ/RimL family protein N-acetyltransferase